MVEIVNKIESNAPFTPHIEDEEQFIESAEQLEDAAEESEAEEDNTTEESEVEEEEPAPSSEAEPQKVEPLGELRAFIRATIEDKAAADESFMAETKDADKSIDECMEFVIAKVKETCVRKGSIGFAAPSNDDIASIAIHYYDADKEEIRKTLGKSTPSKMVVSSASKPSAGTTNTTASKPTSTPQLTIDPEKNPSYGKSMSKAEKKRKQAEELKKVEEQDLFASLF